MVAEDENTNAREVSSAPSKIVKDRGIATTAANSDKNSSGDEIANVNFYAVRPGSYPNSPK